MRLSHLVRKLFIPFLLVSTSVSQAESLTYTVYKGKDKIGKINISRTHRNNTVEYFFESNVKLRVILNIEVYDRMKVIFKGNQMISADLYRTLNGKVKVNNTAIWNGKNYEMTNMDDEKNVLQAPIHLTTASLYYAEPKNKNEVFSEKFQRMIPMKITGNKRYTLQLPGGNKTSYSYGNGVCDLVEADTDWATLRFVRDAN